LCIRLFADNCIIYRKIINKNYCSLTFLIYLFLRFARINDGPFMAMCYKFNLSTYVQEPLVIGRGGCMGRDLNEEMLAVDNGH
jgi:hypothetical protein